jgi:hypothetical protein
VGFASFTILVWDHVITFSDEVSSCAAVICAMTDFLTGGAYMEREEGPQYAFTITPYFF